MKGAADTRPDLVMGFPKLLRVGGSVVVEPKRYH